MGVIRDTDRSCRGMGNRCLLYFTDKKKTRRRAQHVHPITVNKEVEIGSVEVSLLHTLEQLNVSGLRIRPFQQGGYSLFFLFRNQCLLFLKFLIQLRRNVDKVRLWK